MDTDFGSKVKSWRVRKKMTQRNLARRAGIDNSYLSRIERGIYTPPTRDVVLNIANGLNISDPAERFQLLLSANCAGIDDLPANTDSFRDRRSTIGVDIDDRIEDAELNPYQITRLRKFLISVIDQYVHTTRS